MKEFTAKMKFAIADFEGIQNWFHNRGFEIIEEDLIEWCYCCASGQFYFRASESLYNRIFKCDPWEMSKNWVGSVDFRSEAFDPSLIHEMYSPFANRLEVEE